MTDTKTDRRFALALGLSAVGGALASSRQALAQTYRPDEGKELQPGVRQVPVSERNSMGGRDFVLPGYKRIKMIDFVFQPGVERKDDSMSVDMVCQCTEGEMRIDHRHGHVFTARKGDVWTCVKNEPEDVKNIGSVAAIMRVILLMPT
jgi:quercetin dioxygenase-like cupin family protein